ncbi:MAG TPA: hypothetical protein VEF06_05915, partial [Bryobacteraceae bacterium]|nr:hypothetical protein [Bryobacteraceae bacterium]
EVNDWCWQKLPARNLKYYAHYGWFLMLMAWRGIQVITVDRKTSRAAAARIGRFALSRILRRRGQPSHDATT